MSQFWIGAPSDHMSTVRSPSWVMIGSGARIPTIHLRTIRFHEGVLYQHVPTYTNIHYHILSYTNIYQHILTIYNIYIYIHLLGIVVVYDHQLAGKPVLNQPICSHAKPPASGEVPHPPVYVTEKWDGTTMQVQRGFWCWPRPSNDASKKSVLP